MSIWEISWRCTSFLHEPYPQRGGQLGCLMLGKSLPAMRRNWFSISAFLTLLLSVRNTRNFLAVLRGIFLVPDGTVQQRPMASCCQTRGGPEAVEGSLFPLYYVHISVIFRVTHTRTLIPEQARESLASLPTRTPTVLVASRAFHEYRAQSVLCVQGFNFQSNHEQKYCFNGPGMQLSIEVYGTSIYI